MTSTTPTALINAHLTLPAKIVKSLPVRTSLPREDQIQEGTIALIEAAHTFDPTRGTPFDAYARVRITHRIKEYRRSESGPVTMPDDAAVVRNRLAATARTHQDTHGTPPTNADLAHLTGYRETQIATMRTHLTDAISWDQHTTTSTDRTVADTAAAPTTPPTATDLINHLPPLHAATMTLLHGLDGNPALTAAQTADHLGTTPTTIHTTARDATARLTHPTNPTPPPALTGQVSRARAGEGGRYRLDGTVLGAQVHVVVPAGIDDRGWVADADCAGADQSEFFPESKEAGADAAAMCGPCPVVAHCLGYAIATGQGTGVWGGYGPADRRKVKVGLGLSRLVRHGSAVGYQHDGCRCDDCRAAWASRGRLDYRTGQSWRQRVGDRPGVDDGTIGQEVAA